MADKKAGPHDRIKATRTVKVRAAVWSRELNT
jgi:hypothetical protein